MCDNTNKRWISVIATVGALFVVTVIVFVCVLFLNGSAYETSSLDDYGKVIGNFDNEEPLEFIFSFFPEEIDDCFSDIYYHYKAIKGDTYAYECYLEFVIEDIDSYEEFVNRYIDRNASSKFIYDDSFCEESISNCLWLFTSDDLTDVYWIENAKIGKILFSDEQQRIIFLAMGMYDGGGANTEDLGVFFKRFEIDPWEYMKTAYSSEYHEEQGITNEEMPYFDVIISPEG